jgi:hypothetical protein
VPRVRGHRLPVPLAPDENKSQIYDSRRLNPTTVTTNGSDNKIRGKNILYT